MRISNYFFVGALSAAVLVTGCKSKSEPDLLSAKTMKNEIQQFQSKSQVVEGEKAQAALDYLKAEGVTWSSVSGENGNYKFSNLSLEDEDVSIQNLTVTGLQLIGEDLPYVSSVAIEDLKFDEGKVEKIFFNLPDAETFKNIESLDEGNPEDIAEMLIGNFLNFSGGGYMEGLTITQTPQQNSSSAPDSHIKFIGWNSHKAKMSVLLEDMSIDISEEKGPRGKGIIEHISMRNLDMTGLKNISERTAFAGILGQYLNAFNPFKRGYERVAIRGMDFSFKEDDMDVKFKIPRGDIYFTDPKDGIYHQKIEFPEIRYSLDPDSLSRESIPQEVIDKLDLENMVFHYQADLRIDPKSDNVKLLKGGFGWKDNFAFNMTYNLDGFSNYFEALEEMFVELMPSIPGRSFGSPANPSMQNPAVDMEARMQSMFSALVINDFTVELQDQSLMAKGFEIASSQTGQSIDDMKNAAKATITMGTSQAPTDYTRTLSKDFMRAFNSFIDNGGTLRFSINPEKGYSVGRMMEEFIQAESSRDPAAAMAAIDTTLERMNMDFEHLPQ